MELEYKVPGRDAPGFLKRQRKLAEFMELEKATDRWEAMIEYLLEFVTAPEDRDEAREALWNMSEAQYDNMLGALSSQAEVPKNT